MAHLQQGVTGGHASHLDGIATKMEPDQSVQAVQAAAVQQAVQQSQAAQQHATLGTLNQVQQIPTTSTYAPAKPAGDMIDIKKYYENDEEEDQILDQQFTKSFGENKPRRKYKKIFFYSPDFEKISTYDFLVSLMRVVNAYQYISGYVR